MTAIALPSPKITGSVSPEFMGKLRDVLKALFVTNAVAQSRLSAVKTAIDAGTAAIIQIYAGAVPADADAALGAPTLLATLTMDATAFGAISDANPGAIMTAAAITPDASADASGTAAFFRILTQSAGTVCIQGLIATSGADINFNTVAFTAGSEIEITSLTITDPES